MNGVVYIEIEDTQLFMTDKKEISFRLVSRPNLKTYLMGNIGNCQEGEFELYIPLEYRNAVEKWAHSFYVGGEFSHKAFGRFCEYSDKGKLMHEIFLSGVHPAEFPSATKFGDDITCLFHCEHFTLNWEVERRRVSSLCKTGENPLPEYFWELSYLDDSSGKTIYEYYASKDEAEERSLEVSAKDCYLEECVLHKQDMPINT